MNQGLLGMHADIGGNQLANVCLMIVIIKLWHLWQVIWETFRFYESDFNVFGAVASVIRSQRKTSFSSPFSLQGQIWVILHPLPWMSFLVMFPGPAQSPQPRMCCGVDRYQPSPSEPWPNKSFLCAWNWEKEVRYFTCTFYAIWAIRITESIITSSYPRVPCQMILPLTWPEIQNHSGVSEEF